MNREQRRLKGKKGVAIFSLEMPKQQLVKRMLCAEAGITLQPTLNISITMDKVH